MKILCLHCDYIEWAGLKKALKSMADLSPEEIAKKKVEECLVILTAVEKGDSVKESVPKMIDEVKKIAKDVNVENVVLYPYAHLSSNLSAPKIAVEILKKAEKDLQGEFNVSRAPFGYYKNFELKVKGHPLSELSREIKGSDLEGEEVIEQKEIDLILKKLSKVKMQAPRGLNDLKSNVEIGRDLDLFILSEVVGQGLPLLTPKGTVIKHEIEKFIMEEEKKRGYLYTATPVLAKSDLYKISGHWQHYKEDMFTLKAHGETYALRPMTCPFQFVLYKRKPRSYKDLPLKYAEISQLFRKEKSGELRGLTRLSQFTLADAHIICSPKQLEEEFAGVLDLLNYVMKTFGIKDVWYRFSKGDSKNKKGKYVDNPKAWKDAENSMKKILDKLKVKYLEAEDEAAFYGPKLDLQYKDVYGKEDTLLTLQIDFALAEKFDMKYLAKDGTEKKPFVLHRSSSGCTERLMAYLLEKSQGSLPLWLSPVQVKVMTTNESVNNYGKKIFDKLLEEGIRVESDFENDKIGKKVKMAYLEKVFYQATIGDNEEKEKIVSVKSRGEKEVKKYKLDEFISLLKDEIQSRK
jgi:threonyl-tRNA synthetase